MNKSDFLSLVAKKCGQTNKLAKEFFNTFTATLVEVLSKGEEVSFRDFGKFKVEDRPAVRRINPLTKRYYLSSPKKITRFKCFKSFKLCVK